jgi:hypothetical protein
LTLAAAYPSSNAVSIAKTNFYELISELTV